MLLLVVHNISTIFNVQYPLIVWKSIFIPFPTVHTQETKTFHSNVLLCGTLNTNTYAYHIASDGSIVCHFYGKLFQMISSKVIRYLWFYKCQTAKVKKLYPIRHIWPRSKPNFYGWIERIEWQESSQAWWKM